MPARRRDFQRPLGAFLPFDLAQIGAWRRGLRHAGLRFGQALRAFEMIEQADQIGRGADRDAAGPAGFGPLRGGADQPLVMLAGVERGQQLPGQAAPPTG